MALARVAAGHLRAKFREFPDFAWRARVVGAQAAIFGSEAEGERYREVLRHLWLRGADGMHIFQPRRTGFEDIVLS